MTAGQKEWLRLFLVQFFGKNKRKRRNGMLPLPQRFLIAWRMAGCGKMICDGPPYRAPRWLR
jgi:hypothetical protein